MAFWATLKFFNSPFEEAVKAQHVDWVNSVLGKPVLRTETKLQPPKDVTFLSGASLGALPVAATSLSDAGFQCLLSNPAMEDSDNQISSLLDDILEPNGPSKTLQAAKQENPTLHEKYYQLVRQCCQTFAKLARSVQEKEYAVWREEHAGVQLASPTDDTQDEGENEEMFKLNRIPTLDDEDAKEAQDDHNISHLSLREAERRVQLQR
ncbi:hypothetical protein MMC30_004571 [Trapelia coarctata]|nr:hypothetical protein [Trapelia coarctata]